MLTQSRTSGHVTGWTNSHTSTQYIDFVKMLNISLDLFFSYSCHPILECCVMFSGVKLSIKSFVLFIRPGCHVATVADCKIEELNEFLLYKVILHQIPGRIVKIYQFQEYDKM